MKTLKYLFVSFVMLCVTISIASAFPVNEWSIPENAGPSVAKASLTNTPHPGGDHIVIESLDYIKVHPIPKPVINLGDGFPVDARNIQWAIDNVAANGTVELLMTDINGAYRVFDLYGDYIEVRNDVTIKGEKLPGSVLGDEWDPNDPNQPKEIFTIKIRGQEQEIISDRAVIYSGGIPAWWPHYAAFTITGQNKVNIEGLRLEKPDFCGIMICSSSPDGVMINDNVITNVVELPFFAGPRCAYGVLVTEVYQFLAGFPHFISGPVTIENNYLNNLLGLPDPTLYGDRIGIDIVLLLSEVDVLIRENTIENFSTGGMVFLGHYISRIEADGNIIKHREYLTLVDLALGISAHGFPFADIAPFAPGISIIKNNEISGAEGGSIYLYDSNDSEISGNLIDVEDATSSAIRLDELLGFSWGGSHRNTIAGNTITGASDSYGVWLCSNASYNEVGEVGVNARNDFSGFSTSKVGGVVFLESGTSYNQVYEPTITCPDITDNGSFNEIKAGPALLLCP